MHDEGNVKVNLHCDLQQLTKETDKDLVNITGPFTLHDYPHADLVHSVGFHLHPKGGLVYRTNLPVTYGSLLTLDNDFFFYTDGPSCLGSLVSVSRNPVLLRITSRELNVVPFVLKFSSSLNVFWEGDY